MYETIEHWKEYQKQKKIEKLEQELKVMLKKSAIKELDKFINELSIKNGTTLY